MEEKSNEFLNEVTYRINNFIIFNLASRELFSHLNLNNKIQLTRPAAKCLRILIEKKREIVMQQYLYDQVWGEKGRYITSNTLYQNISLIRRAFRSLGLQVDTIITHSGQGFCFEGTVEVVTCDQEEVVCKSEILNEIHRPGHFFYVAKHFLFIPMSLFVVCVFYLSERYGYPVANIQYYKQSSLSDTHNVYIPSGMTLKRESELIDFLKANLDVDLKSGSYYISENEIKTRLSILVCYQGIEVLASCYSHYYING